MADCRHCKLEIKEGTTKCPHCLGWQSKWMPDPQSPRGLLLFLVPLLIFLLAVFVFTWAFTPSDSLRTSQDLEITSSEVHYSERDGARYVAIIGRVRNRGSKMVKNPHFSVRFLNSKGELVDSLARAVPDLIIPPGAELTFRVRGPAHQPADEYTSYEIVITGVADTGYF